MDDGSRPPASADDLRQVAALRAGDEAAFAAVLDRYHAALVRLAMIYVPSFAEAEEVAQETWIGVLRGLDRFEGRSSLKTWIFRILTNQAKRRGRQAARTVPFSSVRDPGAEGGGHWSSPLPGWGENPEECLIAGETRVVIGRAIARLPPSQRAVIMLRDVEGWSADEACDALEISEGNQRVLLHRARSRVRQTLAVYLGGG